MKELLRDDIAKSLSSAYKKMKLNEYGMEGQGSYEDLDDTKDSGEGFKHMRDNELRMKYGIEQGENIDLEFLQTVERLLGKEIAEKIADIKDIYVQEVANSTYETAHKLFAKLNN